MIFTVRELGGGEGNVSGMSEGLLRKAGCSWGPYKALGMAERAVGLAMEVKGLWATHLCWLRFFLVKFIFVFLCYLYLDRHLFEVKKFSSTIF
jgi:hypothetical protein